MRGIGSLLIGILAISGAVGPASADDTTVALETSRSLYEPGESVQATLTNKRSESIFISGCGAVVAEVLDDEKYQAVPGAPCVTEGVAVKVEPGATHKFEIPEAGRSGEVRRVTAAFGWGCEAERPLSQARCTEFSTAVSASFRVGRRSNDEK